VTLLLILPFPVSVNAMYANRKKGRYCTAQYTAWKEAAGWELQMQKPEKITGLYRLTIMLHETDRRRRDPDNFVKCVSDLLVSHGVVSDDSNCVSLSVERYADIEHKCTVALRTADKFPILIESA